MVSSLIDPVEPIKSKQSGDHTYRLLSLATTPISLVVISTIVCANLGLPRIDSIVIGACLFNLGVAISSVHRLLYYILDSLNSARKMVKGPNGHVISPPSKSGG